MTDTVTEQDPDTIRKRWMNQLQHAMLRCRGDKNGPLSFVCAERLREAVDVSAMGGRARREGWSPLNATVEVMKAWNDKAGLDNFGQAAFLLMEAARDLITWTGEEDLTVTPLRIENAVGNMRRFRD